MQHMSEIKKLEKGLVEIKGEIAADVLETFREKALKHLGEHLKMDGFRPGHIPANMVEKNVPEMTLLEEMAKLALTKHYGTILEENKIDAIGYPQINITKIGKGSPLGFTIIVTTLPEIKLPDYTQLAKAANATDVELVKDEKWSDDEYTWRKSEKRRLEIIEKIMDATTIEIPDLLIESEVEKIHARMHADLDAMGVKHDEYLAKIGKTEADLRIEWRVSAEKRAKLQLIVAEIAKAEKIKADPTAVDAEVKKVTEVYKDADPVNARLYIESVMENEAVMKFLENQK